VAIFPRAFEMLKLQDLGGAGHDGFSVASEVSEVSQIVYVTGSHGAALKEENWDSIARFILTGESHPPPSKLIRQQPNVLVKMIGYISPAIWVVIAIAVVFAFWTIWGLNLAEWERTALSALLLIGIWKVVTKI
jgi:hypothetical protein